MKKLKIRELQFIFLKNGPIQASFVYFHPFLITISIIQIEKSFDGVLGIRTHSRRMEGADETTELWGPPQDKILVLYLGPNEFVVY